MYFPKHQVPSVALGKVATIDTLLVPPADEQLFPRDPAPGSCVPLINSMWTGHVPPITDGGLLPNVPSTIAESDFHGESLASFRTFRFQGRAKRRLNLTLSWRSTHRGCVDVPRTEPQGHNQKSPQSRGCHPLTLHTVIGRRCGHSVRCTTVRVARRSVTRSAN